MGSTLSLFGANVGALNVLLGALFSFPVNLSLSLCFSGHVICSLAVLLFLLLTPLRNSDLMPTSCWPLTHIFIFLFFATSRAFLFIFVLLKTPPFLSVRSVTDTLHTDCVLSTHWEGGGDPCSLSLFLSFDHHPSYIFLFPCCSSFFLFLPLCPLPLFPSFLPTLLPVCMCMRLISLSSSPLLCLHGDTGMKGWSHADSKEMTT